MPSAAQQYTLIRDILRMVTLGMSDEQIASELNESVERVQAIERSPLFKQHLKEIQDRIDIVYGMNDVASRFKRRAGEAADTIYEIMKTSIKEELRVKTAQDILDRAGYKATEVAEVRFKPILTQDDVDAIASVLPKRSKAVTPDCPPKGVDQDGRGDGVCLPENGVLPLFEVADSPPKAALNLTDSVERKDEATDLKM